MRRFAHRLAFAAILGFGLTCAPMALAGDEALADSLFQEGQAALKRAQTSGAMADYKAACDAFTASHKVDPAPGTLINVGQCSEKQNKIGSAWSAFNGAAELALNSKPPQPERAAAARAEADRLLPRVQKIQLVIKGKYDDLDVKRDGEPVPKEGLAFPIIIDVGKHTLEVSAKGKKPATKEFEIKDLKAGGKPVESIEIPALVDADKPAGPGGPDYTPPVVVGDGSGQRTVGIVVGGAGILAFLIAGGVFILANSEANKRDEFKSKFEAEGCQNKPAPLTGTCKSNSEGQKSHNDAAQNDQLIAIITGAGGVVLLGVGAVLFFTAPKNKGANKPYLLPSASPGYAGAVAGFSF
jgi:hypothetical protein